MKMLKMPVRSRTSKANIPRRLDDQTVVLKPKKSSPFFSGTKNWVPVWLIQVQIEPNTKVYYLILVRREKEHNPIS